MPAILGDEMKMISRNAERAGEAGRPQANERPFDVLEVKFALRFGGLYEARTFLRWTDRSGANGREVAIKTNRVEDVRRIAQAIALSRQLGERRQGPDFDVDLRSKSGLGDAASNVERFILEIGGMQKRTA